MHLNYQRYHIGHESNVAVTSVTPVTARLDSADVAG